MSAYPQQRQHGTFLDNGQHRCEDPEQPCNQFVTESMAAPFSALTSSESLLESSSLPDDQQGILVKPDVRRHHPSKAHYQPEAQRYLCSVDLFRTDVATLLSLKRLTLPSHTDSIRADLFSQQMSSSSSNPIDMLECFRQKSISAYVTVGEAPIMFSYARAKANHHFMFTRFGVSAPRSQCDVTFTTSAEVRNYRRRQCWGEQKPPVERELWKHGNCAESQSLPAVVARCERLGLKYVVVETLAMHRSGRSVGMCKNCIDYIFLRILRKHPTWRVYDVHARRVFQVT